MNCTQNDRETRGQFAACAPAGNPRECGRGHHIQYIRLFTLPPEGRAPSRPFPAAFVQRIRPVTLLGRVVLLGLCCVHFSGCASKPPPQEPSRPRIQAERAYGSGQDEYRRQNWMAAANLFGRAADFFASIDDYDAEATARHNQAQALKRAGEIDAAIEAYEKSRVINERLGRKTEQAQNLAGIASCQRSQGQLDQAIKTAGEALSLGVDSRSVTATLENDLGLYLLQRGDEADRERIVELFSSALKANRSAGNKRFEAVNHLNLGRAHARFDQADLAEKHFQDALTLFRDTGDPVGLAHSHEQLWKLYRKRGDESKAAFHHEQAREKFEFLKDEKGLKRLGDPSQEQDE